MHELASSTAIVVGLTTPPLVPVWEQALLVSSFRATLPGVVAKGDDDATVTVFAPVPVRAAVARKSTTKLVKVLRGTVDGEATTLGHRVRRPCLSRTRPWPRRRNAGGVAPPTSMATTADRTTRRPSTARPTLGAGHTLLGQRALVLASGPFLPGGHRGRPATSTLGR